jgi:hypothetical protein
MNIQNGSKDLIIGKLAGLNKRLLLTFIIHRVILKTHYSLTQANDQMVAGRIRFAKSKIQSATVIFQNKKNT